MARSEYQHLTWTEKDWAFYESSSVTIALPLLEKLMGATEELARGARPGKEARAHYTQIAEKAKAIWNRATEQYGS